MSVRHDPQTEVNEFVSKSELPRTSFLSDILYFLRHNRTWWMLPLILLLVGFGALLLLASSGAAPFIYTLF